MCGKQGGLGDMAPEARTASVLVRCQIVGVRGFGKGGRTGSMMLRLLLLGDHGENLVLGGVLSGAGRVC